MVSAGVECSLGNLPKVLQDPDFQQANAGFQLTHQLVDVPDFQGKGESSPTPFFYQNLGFDCFIPSTTTYSYYSMY